MSEHHSNEPSMRDAAAVSEALIVGMKTAKDIVIIANSSDMGELREDATAEALRRLLSDAPEGLQVAALIETVKTLGFVVAAYSDEIQGRNQGVSK